MEGGEVAAFAVEFVAVCERGVGLGGELVESLLLLFAVVGEPLVLFVEAAGEVDDGLADADRIRVLAEQGDAFPAAADVVVVESVRRNVEHGAFKVQLVRDTVEVGDELRGSPVVPAAGGVEEVLSESFRVAGFAGCEGGRVEVGVQQGRGAGLLVGKELVERPARLSAVVDAGGEVGDVGLRMRFGRGRGTCRARSRAVTWDSSWAAVRIRGSPAAIAFRIVYSSATTSSSTRWRPSGSGAVMI